MNSETLQKLLADGLALMAENDPAKPCVRASLTASADLFTRYIFTTTA
jgi:hypothetical protein